MLAYTRRIFCQTTGAAARRVTTTTSKPLPTHRDAHKVTNLRRPQFPRAGGLEPVHLVTDKYADHDNATLPTAPQGLAYIGDVTTGNTGKLSAWRDAVTQLEFHDHSSTKQPGLVVPTWDFIVPLLESIKEHGRVLNGASRSRFATVHHRSPYGYSESDVYNGVSNPKLSDGRRGSGHIGSSASPLRSDRLVSNENEATLNLLPLGDRVTPEALCKQFRIELSVRLPLLEQSLLTSCTPHLLGRLCRVMLYCGVEVPQPGVDFAASASHSASAGVADSKFRLRALLVAACRQSELLLAEEEKELEKLSENPRFSRQQELRKMRRLVLDAPVASAVFDLLVASKSTLKKSDDVVEKKLSSFLRDTSVVFVDLEKECPRLFAWATSGVDAQEQQQTQQTQGTTSLYDMFQLPHEPQSPVPWNAVGKLEKYETAAEPKATKQVEK